MVFSKYFAVLALFLLVVGFASASTVSNSAISITSKDLVLVNQENQIFNFTLKNSSDKWIKINSIELGCPMSCSLSIGLPTVLEPKQEKTFSFEFDFNPSFANQVYSGKLFVSFNELKQTEFFSNSKEITFEFADKQVLNLFNSVANNSNTSQSNVDASASTGFFSLTSNGAFLFNLVLGMIAVILFIALFARVSHRVQGF